MENLICNQYGERLAVLNTKRMNNKVATKNAISLRFLPHLQKTSFLISQGSVATCLTVGG